MTIRALADNLPASDVLAYIPSPPRGVWDIGPFPLRAYAICIIIGIVAAIWLGEKRWQQRGGQQGMVLDVAMFAVPLGLIGGRLYHVATDWSTYFGPGGKSGDWWKIWQGGLGIWGAVLLGAIGAWIGCRVYKIPLTAFGDAIAPGILLAQGIGRLGNYFNQELFGRATTMPWGLEIYDRFDANGGPSPMNGSAAGPPVAIVQPTFLYELIWNLLGVAVLLWADRKYRIGHGRLFALYVAIYCFGRFFVELLRDDHATHIAGIRINSFTSAIVFLCAIAYFIFATKGRETAEQVRAGVERPWPWQFGALRAYGAASAGTEVVAADEAESDAESGDTAVDLDKSESSESESASDAESETGTSETSGDDSDSESPSEGNESAEVRDNSSESGDSDPVVPLEETKTVDSGKNGS
ncbi:prolipoprotein diacylglyceryl transferase [Nocardia sp. NBC_01503]|uniref:prolipoprotein diacylglyceryl transferase n=1 Tax=Nocardia sp. NBC_01503 TaxID=2975997 RepID=UPI002E7C1FD6|nr:prolipoprotein diacylglyceryl transferase [Nocardia sp. NBC_01503]WTL32393.1 prolipoprotein diacylglyceryl transferase [Nocardia sp. NBC_01503]